MVKLCLACYCTCCGFTFTPAACQTMILKTCLTRSTCEVFLSSSSFCIVQKRKITTVNMSTRRFFKRCNNQACPLYEAYLEISRLNQYSDCDECGNCLSHYTNLPAVPQNQWAQAAEPSTSRSRPRQGDSNRIIRMSQTRRRRQLSLESSPSSSNSSNGRDDEINGPKMWYPLPDCVRYKSLYDPDAEYCRYPEEEEQNKERSESPDPRRKYVPWCFNCHRSGHRLATCPGTPARSWTFGQTLDGEEATGTPDSPYSFMVQLIILSNLMMSFDSFVKARDAAQYSALVDIRDDADDSSNETLHAQADELETLFAEGNHYAEQLQDAYARAARHAWSSLMQLYSQGARPFRTHPPNPANWRVLSRLQKLVLFWKLIQVRRELGLDELEIKERDVTKFRTILDRGIRTYRGNMLQLLCDSAKFQKKDLLKGTSMSNRPWFWLQPLASNATNFVPALLFRLEDARYDVYYVLPVEPPARLVPYSGVPYGGGFPASMWNHWYGQGRCLGR